MTWVPKKCPTSSQPGLGRLASLCCRTRVLDGLLVELLRLETDPQAPSRNSEPGAEAYPCGAQAESLAKQAVPHLGTLRGRPGEQAEPPEAAGDHDTPRLCLQCPKRDVQKLTKL